MEPEVWKQKLQGLFSPLRLWLYPTISPKLSWAFQNLIKITSGHSNFSHTWKKGTEVKERFYFIRLSPEARLIILKTILNNLLFPEWEISTSVFTQFQSLCPSLILSFPTSLQSLSSNAIFTVFPCFTIYLEG